MALIRSTACFAAGVVVGALGRDALPKLKDRLPELKEQFAPVIAAAVAGARDAAGDACTHVMESARQTMAASREGASDASDRVAPAA